MGRVKSQRQAEEWWLLVAGEKRMGCYGLMDIEFLFYKVEIIMKVDVGEIDPS